MPSFSSTQVRRAFLDHFVSQGHREVASSSLVPADDPSLLFVNSGMVQFKEVFLGRARRDYDCATTSQKCMRVSGKHNDLEEVGPSPSHHTFFEMLGNFSFGAYFKPAACHYAYELLTKTYGLPPDRLVYTVYHEDDEAHDIWVKQMGIDPRRVARLGPATNFWQMADTGPCGPTSEIHWDRHPEQGEESIIPLLQREDERFLEIWNLVFMQFNRTQADPKHSGTYDQALPQPGVDTGMGLERITSVLQDVASTYETDLFQAIMDATAEITGHGAAQRRNQQVAYRVIADHARAAVFLIADGVRPGAKGRDSVCRTVIRRAARFGQQLGLSEPFLHRVAQTVIAEMGEHYGELRSAATGITQEIHREEERFSQTLSRGIGELDAMLAQLSPGGELAGERAFYLYATLGLPLQVTKDISGERGHAVDLPGYQAAEAEHTNISGATLAVAGSPVDGPALLQQLEQAQALPENGSSYEPYGPLELTTEALAFSRGGQLIPTAIVGESVEVLLARQPFYAEAGGQVSDRGTLIGDGWQVAVQEVLRPLDDWTLLRGEVIEGQTQAGPITAIVDGPRRRSIIRNHTATHLLHAALRKVLGEHVQQRGSLVAPDRLRFDFTHGERLHSEILREVERIVNQHILANDRVTAAQRPLEEARCDGAMALFGEKYGEEVRTIAITDSAGARFSYELCGGLHVTQTAEIGPFVLISEGSVSAGVRRVEALTGSAALQYIRETRDQLQQAAETLAVPADRIPERLQSLQQELAQLKRRNSELERSLAQQQFREQLLRLEDIGPIPALITQFDGTPMATMREMADWFRAHHPSGVLILGSVYDGKPQLLATVSDDWQARGLQAGQLMRAIAPNIGGGGGGRPGMAQAGGSNPVGIVQALEEARCYLADFPLTPD
ncbi:MAG: alanine--tRNA ligase [Chloroflexi bacterium]|nr:alanine--tRNA ligase [Chloroflexota bacterium]